MVPLASPYAALQTDVIRNSNPMLSLSAFPYYTPFSRDGSQPTRFPAGSAPHYSNWLVAAKESLEASDAERDPAAELRHEKPRRSPLSQPSCQGYTTPMNGANDLVMTGSSNPRAEQLSWLAEVAAGTARAAQGSPPGHGKDLLHNSECHPQRGPLNSLLLGQQRLYAAYPPERFHQTSAAAAAGRLSLYYSQAPRTAPYSGFYHADHRLPYSQVMADGLLAPRRMPHPYYQSELYAPAITSVQLPHSPGYLHPSASLSPGGLPSSPSSPRMPQAGPLLVSRTADSLTAHDHDKGLQGVRGSPQFHREDRRKSYRSPEPKNLSPSVESHPASGFEPPAAKDPPLRQSSPPHVPYKVPTGKEGSLKHRILRPPSINIVDPPPAVLDAPLSAPPIRSHREPSPKQLKPEGYCSYPPFSPAGAFVIEGSHLLAQPPLASAQSFMAPAASQPAPLKYPHAFMKGSIIQLANSQLKPVELMTTEDFLECEALSANLKIDSSSVVCIEKMPATGSAKLGFAVGANKHQITVEAPLEHPFFVYKQGWSSCSPERSLLRYRLPCSKLKVGDTCIFLTVKSPDGPASKPPTLVPTSSQEPPAVPPALPPLLPQASALPKKRKRRWSAPCEVSRDATA